MDMSQYPDGRPREPGRAGKNVCNVCKEKFLFFAMQEGAKMGGRCMVMQP
jgi:hypothetical protein